VSRADKRRDAKGAEFVVTDLAKWQAFCDRLGLKGEQVRTAPLGSRVRLTPHADGGTEVWVKRP
jgi:hypothetical protein